MPASAMPVIAVLVAAVLAGCGDTAREAAERPSREVELALDFIPNAVHAPIYAAVRTGADRRNGVRLRIRTPAHGPDALKLVGTGRIAIGVLDIHDLAIAREQGVDVVAVGALVQRPLAALIAQPDVRRPRDLEGRRVGVSGLPSDPAFVRAIVEHDGGDVDRVRQVTIGFSAVKRLLTRRVDAAPTFWNAEGIALRRRGRRMQEFRVEEYGAPPYPEVVLVTARQTLRDRPADVRGAVRAVDAGMRAVRQDKAATVRDIARAAETSDRGLVGAQLDAVLPLFAPGIRLDRAVLERWADFDARIGLVERRPDVERAFDFTVAG